MRSRIVLALLAGAVVAAGAELVQTKQILDRLQLEGVTVHLPLLGNDTPVHVAPPQGGGGDTVELPRDVKAMQKRMHIVAGVAAVVAVAVVFAVAGD